MLSLYPRTASTSGLILLDPADCSTSGTLTVTATADASALASCSTYSGSVSIPSSFSVAPGPDGHQSLSIDGVKRITGNLTVTNAVNLAGLSLGNLQQLGGLDLNNLTVLATLNAPQLTQVDTLSFTALPALQLLGFTTGLTKAISVLITNTGLSNLMGISTLQQVDIFNVNNNPALTNISLQVTSIKKSLDIEANDGYISGLSTSFPMLQTAQNMTFRNCSDVQLPALVNVTQDLGFYDNAFTSFTAPNLTTAGGLVFVNNMQLTNISIPQLTSINGTYQIANNTQLKQINGFTKLSVVIGALDFSGNFTEYVIYFADEFATVGPLLIYRSVQLPGLTQIQGAFNMQTSGQFDCSAFAKDHDNKVIKGKYVCQGSETKPGTAGTSASGTSSGSSASPTSSAGRFEVCFTTIAGGFSIVAGLLQFIL